MKARFYEKLVNLPCVPLPDRNSGTTTFRYDPFGRRIQKSGPLGTTNYLYDGPYTIDEVDQSGNVLARYAQSNRYSEGQIVDQPLAELRSGTTSYYQQDGLDSVTSLSNPTGTLANAYTYDSFGKLTASNGVLTNPFQYTGREFDAETGIYEYRARYYDQGAGRFVSEDPLEFKAGIDFYRYVTNRPVNLPDPTGLYQLQGFSPQDAAQMTIAVGQLAAKLKSQPCCVDSKLRDKILDYLQPFGSGGVTFVYQAKLPSGPDEVVCGQVGNSPTSGLATAWAQLTNTVYISADGLKNPAVCGCLPGTLLHEVTHLTWNSILSKDPEKLPNETVQKCFSCAVTSVGAK